MPAVALPTPADGAPPAVPCFHNCPRGVSNGHCQNHCFGAAETFCHSHCYGAFETSCHAFCFGSGDLFCHTHCYGAGDSNCHNQCYGMEDVSCHNQCFGAGASSCLTACFLSSQGKGNSGSGQGPGIPSVGPPSTGPPGGGGSSGGGGGPSGRGGGGHPPSPGNGGVLTASVLTDAGVAGGPGGTVTPGGIVTPGGAGGLGLGTATTTGTPRAGGGGRPAGTVPLAPGTASVGHRAAAGRSRTGTRRGVHRTTLLGRVGSHGLQPLLGIGPAALLEHFIRFIPWWMWLIIGLAFTAAAVAGVAAVRSARQARLREGEVAMVTADAITDPLTGILNRRGFTNVAQRELERAQRYGHPLALAFVDVRGLKTVNDTRGHQAGDELLKQVAALLTASSRSHDVVGRIGGDELAVMLTEQGVDGMAAVMRRVRTQLPAAREALGFDHDWDLTIGMAVFPRDGHSLEDLLATADRRLYMQRGIKLR